MTRSYLKISTLVTKLMELGFRALSMASAPILKNLKSITYAVQMPISVYFTVVAGTTNLLAHFQETARTLFISIDVVTAQDGSSFSNEDHMYLTTRKKYPFNRNAILTCFLFRRGKIRRR